MEKLQKLFIACTIIVFMSVLQAACTNFDEEDAQDDKTCCITAGQQSDGQWICTRGSVDYGCIVVAGCEDRWRVYAINENTGETFQEICDPMSALSEGSGDDADGDSSGDVTNVFYPPTENPPTDDDDQPPADDDNPAPVCDPAKMRVTYQTPDGAIEPLTIRSCDDSFKRAIPDPTNFVNVTMPWMDCFQIDRGPSKWACNAWSGGRTETRGTLRVYECVADKETEHLYRSQDTDPGAAYVGNCVRAD